MPWLAAAAMCGFYIYHLPLVVAIVINGRGLGIGVGVFEPRFAEKSAKKRIIDRMWLGKHGKRFRRPNGKLPSKATLELGLRVLKSARLESLDVRVTIGLDDAALTAQACGILMTLAHTLRATTGAAGTVRVTPDFGKPILSGEARGIVRLTAGHIMKAAAQAYSARRGRISLWKSTPSRG